MVLKRIDWELTVPEGDAFNTGKHVQILRRTATAESRKTILAAGSPVQAPGPIPRLSA
jgi:hypothetical protein